MFAPDLPGFGRSGKIITEVSLAAATGFLYDLMIEFGLEQANVIGHSMGGLINLQFTLHHPERVNNLVLVDSAVLGRQTGLIIRCMSMPLLGEIITVPTRVISWLVLKTVFYDKRVVTDELVYLLYHMRRLPGARRALLAATQFGVTSGFNGTAL